MSLRRHSSSAFRFNSEIMATRKIILDLETFQTFFDSYAEELRRGGLKSNSKTSSQAPGTLSSILLNVFHLISVLYL